MNRLDIASPTDAESLRRMWLSIAIEKSPVATLKGKLREFEALRVASGGLRFNDKSRSEAIEWFNRLDDNAADSQNPRLSLAQLVLVWRGAAHSLLSDQLKWERRWTMRREIV